tara:strand:- start:1813 stop:2271 length:459 start_codon:yes stop_codon:yes gene_type:complete
MGLDCYVVHGNDREKDFTHEDEPRIKDINLCGGMLSGHGANGSFRGKWYEPLVDELMQEDCIWHIEGEDAHITAQELKEQAQALADLLHAVESDAKEQDLLIDDGKTTLLPETIIYQTQHGSPYEYNYQEVKDLELLLRCASERGAVMLCWW